MQVADYGESDKIVTFFSPENGKQVGIAKGAKRSKKRFVNKLELFSLLDIIYTPGQRTSLVRIDQAELVNPFASLRSDFMRYAGASLISELLTNWTRENDPDRRLFDHILWGLATLDKGHPVDRTMVIFHIRLLALLGYRPNLTECGKCGRLDPAKTPYRFHAARSSLVCSACIGQEEWPGRKISMSTIKLLQKALSMEPDKLDRLQFSADSIGEALGMVQSYERHLLQREIHSWRFLNSAS